MTQETKEECEMHSYGKYATCKNCGDAFVPVIDRQIWCDDCNREFLLKSSVSGSRNSF
jgi:ribosomal protein L37AE/L43A